MARQECDDYKIDDNSERIVGTYFNKTLYAKSFQISSPSDGVTLINSGVEEAFMEKILFKNANGYKQGEYFYTVNDFLSARVIVVPNSGGKAILGILKGSSTNGVSELDFELLYTKT